MTRLGFIADDFTGACDLAGQVAAAGMPTTVLIRAEPQSVDADQSPVVALKTRSVPAQVAVAESVRAARGLLDGGAQVLYQKYCSTFDSTDAGNIGPVADALVDLTGAAVSIGTPASPSIDRTVYRGHLFAGGQLLENSPLRDHPINPMRESNLIELLGRQTSRPVAGVSRIEEPAPDRPGLLAQTIERAVAGGARHLIVDAVDDADLDVAAAALELLSERGLRYVLAGGSGLAMALARRAPAGVCGALPPVAPGNRLILAGSCSARTRAQLAAYPGPLCRLDVAAVLGDPVGTLTSVLAWVGDHLADTPAVAASADPEEVAAVQRRFGPQVAGNIEAFVAALARHAVDALGVRGLLVAGGETSGAVVESLGIGALRVGPQVEAGLPWTVASRGAGAGPSSSVRPAASAVGGTSSSVNSGYPQHAGPALALLLKSGNFGADDLFSSAWSSCPMG